MVAQTKHNALQGLCARLFDTLAVVERLQADIANELSNQVDQGHDAIDQVDQLYTKEELAQTCFREWLKQSVYASGRTITDFSNETGLSRQLCNATSRKHDPTIANMVLACEVLAEWQDRALLDVLIDAMQTTKAYKMSQDRLQPTKGQS
jgi:hypothetical protein